MVLADDGNILTLRADGSDLRALTEDASADRIYRQPTWSPSGERVAWAEIVTEGTRLSTALRTARIDGRDATSADAETYPPFYIHWSPEGNRLAYLSNWTRGLALRMVDVAGGGSQAVTLGQGQPFYFDWAPGERRMLTHVGGERLALLSLDGTETRLPGASGLFGAPQWSADGEMLLYALRDSDGQRLILAGADGQHQRDVLPFDGQLSFSLSPDGRKIAYAITTRPVSAASFGPLSVMDLATGESTHVSTHPALGFFWSPDSRSLIYLLPADIGPQAPRAALAAAADDELWLRWHLWNGTNSQELARFAPSATFLIDYLALFRSVCPEHDTVVPRQSCVCLCRRRRGRSDRHLGAPHHRRYAAGAHLRRDIRCMVSSVSGSGAEGYLGGCAPVAIRDTIATANQIPEDSMSFFEGLVVTEEGAPVSVAYIGTTPYYVIDDAGFRRHIEARPIDRAVLAQFTEQLAEHRDEASQAMVRMMGQDDLFTKAAVDSALRNINLDQMIDHGLPPEARQWLGMMGFRVVIDLHGELVRVEMPAVPNGLDEDE